MKTYKTEIVLSDEQKERFLRTIGTCRFVYNLFLQTNKELYEKNKDTDLPKYMNNFEFSKWLNNIFIKNNPEYSWIKEVSSKSIRRTIDNANVAYTRFFKHQSKFPGLGIDLGVKNFAVLSDGARYKTLKQQKLNKRLVREQKALSRKYKAKKKNKKEGATHKNIEKQKLRVQKIYQRIANTRHDYQNKVIAEIIKREPSFITIEDLNVRGMMKNRHLSRAIANQGFSQFVSKLKYKCYLNGIELRQVDRFYPSSKICCLCGQIKTDLKLSERVYRCDCGNTIDRDYNASINLKNAGEYKVIA